MKAANLNQNIEDVRETYKYPLFLLLIFVFIFSLGFIDFITGFEISFSLFYLAPIYIAAWYINRIAAIIFSIIAAVVWLVADIYSGHIYSHSGIYVWNSSIRLIFFLIVANLIVSLKHSFNKEKELARHDNKTGAVNNLYFNELLQWENDLSGRYDHPYTLAYIDLDNFKEVNDRFGHATGDGLLKQFVNTVNSVLRKTDILGRVGGDEFVLLLPETNPEIAKTVISKIQTKFLKEMEENGWPVTLSIGVLSVLKGGEDIKKIISRADELMYSVKHGGKNGIAFDEYETLATN